MKHLTQFAALSLLTMSSIAQAQLEENPKFKVFVYASKCLSVSEDGSSNAWAAGEEWLLALSDFDKVKVIQKESAGKLGTLHVSFRLIGPVSGKRRIGIDSRFVANDGTKSTSMTLNAVVGSDALSKVGNCDESSDVGSYSLNASIK